MKFEKRNDASLFISLCLDSITVFHAEHFVTKSYAMHKTLEQFYEDMPDKVDVYAEAYIGSGGVFVYTPSIGLSVNEMLHKILTHADICRDKQSPELQTLIDEIKVLCKQTMYRMTLK